MMFIMLSLVTTFADHTYRTQCAVEVEAPVSMSDKVIDQLIYDFQYDFEHLFDWAFFKVGKQNDDDRDALLLASKNIVYKPEQEYGSITLDVIVPRLITMRDITIEGTIKDERNKIVYSPKVCVDTLVMENMPAWSRHIDIRANPSSFIFKQAYGNLFVIPVSETRSIYLMDINFCFEWYLRAFVTQRIYRNTIQWRVEKYMNNLKYAAEHPEIMAKPHDGIEVSPHST